MISNHINNNNNGNYNSPGGSTIAGSSFYNMGNGQQISQMKAKNTNQNSNMNSIHFFNNQSNNLNYYSYNINNYNPY